MNLDQAKQTFVEESRDLLQNMEDILLRVESDGVNEEDINAIFRTAHTIKGSAGLFGLDYVVSFTHAVENLLDKIRDGEIAIAGELIALLLASCDHMRVLVDCVAAADGAEPAAEITAQGDALIVKLRAHSGAAAVPAVQVAPAQAGREHAVAEGGVAADTWHISLRFGPEVLRNGMDPLSFLRYLGTLGELVSVATLLDGMPAAAEMDAESCYLGFEIDFRGEVSKTSLENVFEFVRDDCRVNILPPHSRIVEYLRLVAELPESAERLGEILVASGALTRSELAEALTCQRGQDVVAQPLGEIIVQQGFVQKPVVEAALEKQKQVRDSKTQESHFIRVHADKLDLLINLVGELVIAGASANLLAQRAGQAALQEATSVMSRLVEEIRDGALRLRMVEIGDTFHRFQRVVRDVSQELGKEIELVISGAETELDKTVVEKIGDPLMHLVRNAIDHGIESAAVREAKGKKAKGTLRLNAFHDSGSIVIEVADDGGGLNRDRILHKALEQGLVSAGQSPTDQEIFNLVFEAGFSTADKVTNLSGRGVGMDVVRRNIEALRGTVEIGSEAGQGTTVKIRLPLTLAIIDGFLVGVGKSAYVVPLDMVLECVELSEADRKATREHNYINLRGEVLPFLRLRDQFELEEAQARRENIVVVHYAGEKAGLVVDELMGEFQTVIKPLSTLFSNLKGISGSTILGSGEVALILDVPSLVQQTVNRETHSVSSNLALEVH
ncbi:MAG: chemotaxis protein CheA [Sulfuricella sp.]|nr:chemotaxis protein CheA [Sulfuricella sp.]